MSAVATSAQPSRDRASLNPTPSRANGSKMEILSSKMASKSILRYFDPTAATASMFLYAQGNSVVCCHHDTLTIERRFTRHSDEVQILVVDNQSELGAGRLVVSYDASQTAFVWDLITGDEVARFVSCEHLTAAAWMRNGNIAFGNAQGHITLLEPTTSEHISARTIDQIAVTALAPSADCRTFAIGYQNGNLLIATLQPRFTILHNLTTSRGPSPIVTLSWHASSLRQKSDMLAVQTNDGDLRVWSLSKAYNSADPAKVVRILRKTETIGTGAHWMSWSKNGRIIQFCQNETLSWDVRTKHVTCDQIPTLDPIKGLAVYGPGASLFTLGANNTVQQFDLNAPAVMVTNVQHPANLLPPSPPVSIEEQEKGAITASASASESETGSIHISANISESDDDSAPPMARIARAGTMQMHMHVNPDEDLYRTASPASSRSGASDVSSTSSQTPGRYQASLQSRSLTDNTYISTGSTSFHSSAVQAKVKRESSSFSTSSLSSISVGSSTSRTRHRPSRLRHEAPRSLDDSRVTDLFKFTRSRLSDLPYKRPLFPKAASRLANDDLRRQMLCTIFGWTKEAEDLVRDEIGRNPPGSPSRILLAKWLGDIDPDTMASRSENMTSSDWMLLALSGIGGTAAQLKLGRAYVQRLLENGDIHSAVTIMIGMGDRTDAIEVYISHKKFLEALILSCICFPSVWERQLQIVRKWGEFAVQHGHQQLAIRCFACTDMESSEPWTSPSAQQVSFQNINTVVTQSAGSPEMLSPPLSPPGFNHGPQRSIAKTSALKLITSFGDHNSKSKFFSCHDGGQTPIAAGVTPIAESAISPRGDEMSTAFLTPSSRSAFSTPTTALAQSRGRLPSIGEMPSDNNLRNTARMCAKPAAGAEMHTLTPMLTPTPTLPLPTESSARRGQASKNPADERILSTGQSLHRVATDSPMMMMRREPSLPSPSPESQTALLLASGRNSRNGPRERMPSGLDLQLQSLDNSFTGDVTSPEQSMSSSRFHWPSRRRGPGSLSSATSAAATGISIASTASNATKTSSTARNNLGGHGQKSLDEHISSMEANEFRSRGNSQDGRAKIREGDTSRNRQEGFREPSADGRGRTTSRGYRPSGAKQSPRSPISMSPEDLLNLSITPQHEDLGEVYREHPGTVRKANTVRASSKSKTQRDSSRNEQRLPPLDNPLGRSSGRPGSRLRSPSSPKPMSATGMPCVSGSESEEDYRRAVEDQNRFRSKKNTEYRSGSESREASPSEHRLCTPAVQFNDFSGHAGDLRVKKDERQLKKEAAARELEERRKSLAKRAFAPPIPHPDQLSPSQTQAGMSLCRAATVVPQGYESRGTTFGQSKDLPSRSRTAEPEQQMRSRSNYTQQSTRPVVGLPATPKALRLVMDTQKAVSPDEPAPPFPVTFAQAISPQSQSSHQNSPLKETPSFVPGGPGPGSGPGSDPGPGPGPGGNDILTLLPSTVYQPPTRPAIQRCVSAPPEEPVAPMALQRYGIGRLARGNSLRKLSTPDSHTGYKRAVDDNMVGHSTLDDQLPPTLPHPPLLKELAHLAIPPPPPPAPLPFAVHNSRSPVPIVYGGKTSDAVQVLLDSDDQQLDISAVGAVPLPETTVSVFAAPAPPASRSHHRGRSSVDNSIAGRISRATERLRSSSRSGNNSGIVSRTKSPTDQIQKPYESIPPPPPPAGAPQGHKSSGNGLPGSYVNRDLRNPMDGRSLRDLPTGMGPGDLI